MLADADHCRWIKSPGAHQSLIDRYPLYDHRWINSPGAHQSLYSSLCLPTTASLIYTVCRFRPGIGCACWAGKRTARRRNQDSKIRCSGLPFFPDLFFYWYWCAGVKGRSLRWWASAVCGAGFLLRKHLPWYGLSVQVISDQLHVSPKISLSMLSAKAMSTWSFPSVWYSWFRLCQSYACIGRSSLIYFSVPVILTYLFRLICRAFDLCSVRNYLPRFSNFEGSYFLFA